MWFFRLLSLQQQKAEGEQLPCLHPDNWPFSSCSPALITKMQPPTGLHLITPQPMNRSCGAICLPLTTSPLLQNLPGVLLGVLVYQSEARSFHGPSGGQKAGREVVVLLWERFSCPDIGAGPHGPSAPGFPALLVMRDQGGCSKFIGYQKPEHEQTQQIF